MSNNGHYDTEGIVMQDIGMVLPGSLSHDERDEAMTVIELMRCACGESLMPDSPCLNIGACETADRAASAQSLQKGTAAIGRPAAWTLSGRVD